MLKESGPAHQIQFIEKHFEAAAGPGDYLGMADHLRRFLESPVPQQILKSGKIRLTDIGLMIGEFATDINAWNAQRVDAKHPNLGTCAIKHRHTAERAVETVSRWLAKQGDNGKELLTGLNTDEGVPLRDFAASLSTSVPAFAFAYSENGEFQPEILLAALAVGSISGGRKNSDIFGRVANNAFEDDKQWQIFKILNKTKRTVYWGRKDSDN